MAKMKWNLGSMAFLAGVLMAVLMAFINIDMGVTVLALTGFIVGILNIQPNESQKMLLWTIGLGVVGGLGMLGSAMMAIPMIGIYLESIIINISSMFITVAITFLVVFGIKNLAN